MLLLPPAFLQHASQEIERREYERRYWALIEGSENFGIKATWIGRGDPPKSDWDHDSSEREAHIEALGIAAGLLKPKAPLDPVQRDRAAWQALREQRRKRRLEMN